MRETRTASNAQLRTLHRVKIAGLFTLCAAIIAAGFLPS